MLQLILGGSGSGKTALLYQRIRTLAQAGKKSILAGAGAVHLQHRGAHLP